MFVVRCVMRVVCSLLLLVHSSPIVAPGLLLGVCCLRCVVCRSVVCYLPVLTVMICSMCVVRGLLFVVWLLVLCCSLFVD